jgi:hypothetical protein
MGDTLGKGSLTGILKSQLRISSREGRNDFTLGYRTIQKPSKCFRGRLLEGKGHCQQTFTIKCLLCKTPEIPLVYNIVIIVRKLICRMHP